MRKYTEIRKEIKSLSDSQRVLKPQRKLSYEGVRTPGSVLENKYHLRHLFQAYSILKGKERSKVTKSYLSEHYVQKLVEKYTYVEEQQLAI